MPLDVVLLVVRIAIALALYAFLGMLFIFLWRDLRATSQQLAESRRSLGCLTVIECEGVPLDVGQKYPLWRLTTLGRGPTSTVVLPDSFASVEHARIVLRGSQWWLEDQQSRNGTRLNDIPVKEAVVLSSGDVIGVGRTKLLIEFE